MTSKWKRNSLGVEGMGDRRRWERGLEGGDQWYQCVRILQQDPYFVTVNAKEMVYIITISA